jgi:hypothetical protein
MRYILRARALKQSLMVPDSYRRLEHIPMAAAAALVYYRVTGSASPESVPSQGNDVLSAVAQAMLPSVTIYVGGPAPEALHALSRRELLGTSFSNGGTLLTTLAGRTYRHLTIQRRDMQTAVSMLSAADLPR